MSISSKKEFAIAAAGGVVLLGALSIPVIQIAPILTDVEGTTRTLEAQGFEPTDVGGGVWLGGSQGDFWRTKFKAQNPKGEPIEGYATRGIFKGTTLRFD